MRVVVSLLFIALLVVGGIVLNRGNVHDVQPAAFLPADTLVYLDQKNAQKALDRLQASRLVRTLQRLDVKMVLDEAQVAQKYSQQFDYWIRTVTEMLGSDLVRFLLGKRCTLAIFNAREWSNSPGDYGKYLIQHLLIITKVQENPEAQEALLLKKAGIDEISQVAYGRYIIKRVRVNRLNTSGALAFVDGVVLFAFEERVLREAIDLRDQKMATLRRNPKFLSILRDLDNAERTLYLDMQALQELAVSPRFEAATQQTFLAVQPLLNGLRTLAYGEWRTKRIISNRLLLNLAPEKIAPRILQLAATMPSLNDTLPYAARDALLYYWSNSLDLRLIWQMYVEQAGEASREVAELKSGMKGMSGHDPEELMAMIGTSIAFMLRENVNDHFIPLPDFAILLNLSDQQRGATAFHRILESLGIKTKLGRYKYVNYHAWGLDPSENLQPVYAIHRDYLILANTLDMLKHVIDTPLNNSRLVGTKSFRELDPGFQTLNNSVCFVNQARLLARLQEMVGWAGTILAIQDRHTAEKTKVLIDKLIDPLFWGLGMYETSAIRTYVEGPRIYIDAKTRTSN